MGRNGPTEKMISRNLYCSLRKEEVIMRILLKDMLDNYLIARTTMLVNGWEKEGKLR